jgi:hypothetical protein
MTRRSNRPSRSRRRDGFQGNSKTLHIRIRTLPALRYEGFDLSFGQPHTAQAVDRTGGWHVQPVPATDNGAVGGASTMCHPYSCAQLDPRSSAVTRPVAERLTTIVPPGARSCRIGSRFASTTIGPRPSNALRDACIRATVYRPEAGSRCPRQPPANSCRRTRPVEQPAWAVWLSGRKGTD